MLGFSEIVFTLSGALLVSFTSSRLLGERGLVGMVAGCGEWSRRGTGSWKRFSGWTGGREPDHPAGPEGVRSLARGSGAGARGGWGYEEY